MGTRYTAVIKVVKVEETDAVVHRYAEQSKPATSKDTELANIVVRHNDLDTLLSRAKAHLDLVDES